VTAQDPNAGVGARDKDFSHSIAGRHHPALNVLITKAFSLRE
jgi:hypothetical protein